MSEGGAYQISTRINQKLAGLSKTCCEQFIFKIHEGLRKTNEMAYEPEILSIGPYHHGKKKLQRMEKYKLEYLEGILKRQNESSTERYIDALMQDQAKARSYYADDVSLNGDDFAEMMLLDGCFIIEFLRKYEKKEELKDDPIFKMSWISNGLLRDLLLFENQVPFFILEKLFEMTKIPNEEKDLHSLAISCLYDRTPVDKSYDIIPYKRENVFHLLSLMYEIWCSFTRVIGEEGKDDCRSDLQNEVIGEEGKDDCRSDLQNEVIGEEGKDDCRLDLQNEVIGEEGKGDGRSKLQNEVSRKLEQEENHIEFIKTVTELKKHGIKFVKLENSKSWLDIKFENSKSWLDIIFENREMKIPPLLVEDGTESALRNLIAYEQYMFDLGHSGQFVTDYTTLMDCLINKAEDVEVLRHQGIIKNWLGNDEAITEMFNNICKNVLVCPPEFSYQTLFKQVNEHCSKRRKWIANLKSTYFKNPWSIISLVAATFLLLLTLIQTVVSILQQIGL